MSAQPHKIVLITGATAGIGKATANVFAKHGFNLILTGRRADRLEEIKSRLEKKYAIEVQTLIYDVQDRQQVKNAIESLSGKWKEVDILINNAGLALGADEFDKASIDDWEIMIDTNVKGLLYMSRIISPIMVEKGCGHIINVCSTVRVSQVSPGAVEETEFSLVRYKGDQERAKIYEDYNPLTSRDVGKAIYFIASQPKHVAIHDLVMTGAQQASATIFDKSGRSDR